MSTLGQELLLSVDKHLTLAGTVWLVQALISNGDWAVGLAVEPANTDRAVVL